MADVYPVVKDWKTALGKAASSGRDETVRSLLRSDAINREIRNASLKLATQSAISSRAGRQSTALLLFKEFYVAQLVFEEEFRTLFLRAVDKNYEQVVQYMLRCGAAKYLEYRDEHTLQRTPFFAAALKGHTRTLEILRDAGANMNARAAKGHNVLTFLAAEKGIEKNSAVITIRWILQNNESLLDDVVDQKNALHWAAVTGKLEMAKILLATSLKIDASSDRGRTALHYAAGGDCADDAMVDLLLGNGADATRRSDGGWTPLHNAAHRGNLKAVIRLLNEEGVDINAALSSRVTPLHWAAGNGHEEVVKYILAQEHAHKHRKDVFGSTPMIRAAQNNHTQIARLFHPCHDVSRLTTEQQKVCKSYAFQATVVDFEYNRGQGPPDSRVNKISMFNLLYDEKISVRNRARSLNTKGKFRWIHLPANNMAWAETLFAKLFVEGGAADVDSFKSLQRTMSHQHRGRHVHSTFMIPHCTHIRHSAMEAAWLSNDDPSSRPSHSSQPQVPVTPSKGKDNRTSKPKVQLERDLQRAKTKKMKLRRQSTNSTFSSLSSHRQDSASEPPHDDSDKDPPIEPREASSPARHGSIALFMPYLHFESHERRVQMTDTIKAVKTEQKTEASAEALRLYPDDVMLVRAYLDSSPSLHPRRTLDQFLYHSFDTEKRDIDQVVFRYFRDTLKVHPKIYMVDQLWLWVLGEDLIVTSFPQRWGQSKLKNDPLCVLDGVVEDINSKTRPPVRSVHDLAMLITGRCAGGFDRHRLGEQEYQFLDMFDSSIGDLSVKEPVLFEKFERASSAAATWLHEQEGQRETQKGASLAFVNDLLDIKKETTLLKELKDIRDELNIIKSIFTQQRKVLKVFEDAVCEERREDRSEAERRFSEQSKLTKLHIEDVERMDDQAQAIFTSLTQLLDFKQKHANAIEARFAREQAEFTAGQSRLTSRQAELAARQGEIAARQGETIMVFTIVTIFFLPMSFIAAFFTINIADFPRLSLTYVSKYVFGIGLSISLVLITVAFLVDDIRKMWHRYRRSLEPGRAASIKIDITRDTMVGTPPPVARIHKNESEVFAQPSRVLSSLSAVTGKSAVSGAYSRYNRDPEWGR